MDYLVVSASESDVRVWNVLILLLIKKRKRSDILVINNDSLSKNTQNTVDLDLLR